MKSSEGVIGEIFAMCKCEECLLPRLQNLVKAVREDAAFEIKGMRKMNHETHQLPWCPKCIEIAVLDRAAAKIGGSK